MRKQHFLLMGTLSIFLCLVITACQNTNPNESQFQCGTHSFPLETEEQLDFYTCVHLPDSMQVIQQLLTDLETNKQLNNNEGDRISKAIQQLSQLPVSISYLAIAKFLKYQSVAVNTTNKEKTLDLLRTAETLLKKHQANRCDSIELLVLHSYLSYYLDNDFGKGEEAILHTQIAINGNLHMNRIKELALEYANLAKLYTRYQKDHLADDYLRQALCIWENVAIKSNEELYVYAHAVHSVAVLNYTKGLQHYRKRELGQASNLFQASLNSISSLLALSKIDSFNQNLIADIQVKALTSIGKIYLTGHKIIDQIPSVELFQPVLAAIPTQDAPAAKQTKSSIYPSLAFIYAKLDSFERADQLLEEGLTNVYLQTFEDSLTQYSPQNILDHWDFVKGLSAKAGIQKLKYEQTKQLIFLKNALDTELQILSFLEQMRHKMTTDIAKENFMELASIHYSQANQTARILYEKTQQQQFLALAFQITDQGKSVILRQEIYHKLQTQQEAANSQQKAIFTQEKVFKQKLWELKQQLYSTDLQLTSDTHSQIRDSILYFSKAFQQFKTQLSTGTKVERNYALAQSEGNIPTISAIQQNWLDDKTAILAYQVGYESAAVFVITQFKKECFPITIDSTFFALNHLLQESLQFGLADYPEEAYQLFLKVLSPTMSFFKDNQVKHLVIIPDEVIAQIPFAALLTKEVPMEQKRAYDQFPYLIHDFTTSYLPALSIYHMLQQLGNSTKKEATTFAAFIANPALSKAKSTTYKDANFTQQKAINFIDVATQSITTKHFQTTDLIRQATKGAFQKIAPTAQLLHLSLHGIHDIDYHFLNNYLSFTPDSLNNGELTLGEIYGMDLQADLAFLASCNSGKGSLHASEGLLSIQRAFLYAGCKGTISTLQAVEDKRAAEITENFYHYFREKGFSVTVALAMAQREYILTMDPSDPKRAHPANWANYRYSGIDALTPLILANPRAAQLYSLE